MRLTGVHKVDYSRNYPLTSMNLCYPSTIISSKNLKAMVGIPNRIHISIMKVTNCEYIYNLVQYAQKIDFIPVEKHNKCLSASTIKLYKSKCISKYVCVWSSINPSAFFPTEDNSTHVILDYKL